MPDGSKGNPNYVVLANADGLQVATLSIERIGVYFQGPDMAIPDGYQVVVLSHPNNVMLGLIQVAGNKTPGNDNIPLRPGQTVPLWIKNTNRLWLAGTAAGDMVVFYSELIKPQGTSPYTAPF
jgi:hypothetical protein